MSRDELVGYLVTLFVAIVIMTWGVVSEAADGTFMRPGVWRSQRLGAGQNFPSEQAAVEATLASYNQEHGCTTYALVSTGHATWFGFANIYRFGTEQNPDLCTTGIQIEYWYTSQCPAGTTNIGGTPQMCACPQGTVWDGAQCVAPSCVSGASAGNQQWFSGWDPDRVGWVTVPSAFGASWPLGRLCVDNCQAEPDLNSQNINCFAYDGALTKIYCTSAFKYTGATCTGGDSPPDVANANDPCPAGMGVVSLNGVERCVNNDFPPVPKPDQKSSTTTDKVVNPDGSTTVTITTINPDGSKTVTVSIYAPGVDPDTGKPESSTTTKTVQGPGEGKDGDTPLAEYCRDNPNSPLCRSSSFGGTCGAFSCEGDAIQCAIAREIHQRNCEFYTTETALSTRGAMLAQGDDPDAASNPANVANREEVDVGNIIGSRDRLWGSASCPEDYTFAWSNGAQVTVPLGMLCQPLQLVGALVVAFAFMVALRIAVVI